jgi:hypothetical protein
MGFLLSDAEYFIDLCREYGISGKMLTLGRQDVWLTENHFGELLQSKGYGRQSNKGFVYNDKEVSSYEERNLLVLSQLLVQQGCYGFKL